MMATPLFQSREEDAYGSNVPDPNENISTSPHLRAIEEAMEATRKYGATSKEARVAWEIAEEIEDSIFSPCSKRCDPLPRSTNGNENVENDIPPLFVDKSTLGDKSEGE